ncbi:MAG: hypothetical protein E4G74_03865 [Erysipelotrichales bacterium]|nr:MAG: hypothetical protein E4G74_03865 [Erysipelotrichales bacterium]
MTRKSNKTEQVLKLITKDEDILDHLSDRNDRMEDGKRDTKASANDNIQSSRQKETTDNLKDAKERLVNLTEELVLEHIGVMMERMKLCRCLTCTMDVLALTLNSLPQRYITTDLGRQHFQVGIYKKQYEANTRAAIAKACIRVKTSPRHGKTI